MHIMFCQQGDLRIAYLQQMKATLQLYTVLDSVSVIYQPGINVRNDTVQVKDWKLKYVFVIFIFTSCIL